MNVNPNRQNVEKVFYSKRNFNMLCSVIRDTINKKYGVDPKDYYKKVIYKTMNMIIGRAVIPTTRVNIDMYKITLNKKVLYHIMIYIYRNITTTLLNISHMELNHFNIHECSICFESIENNSEIKTLPCAHIYHDYCINKWLEQKSNCPICRTNV